MLPKQEIERLGLEYTANDISSDELSLAPNWVKTAAFDIATSDQAAVKPFEGAFDLIYSKMVMEHVSDYRLAYRNIHRLLRSGGVAVAFHPVLFSVPFLANYLLPEDLGWKVLTKVVPTRASAPPPKFKAYYSGCLINRRIRQRIKDIGFKNVWQVPFYGHGYYAKVPVVREFHSVVDSLIRKSNFKPLAAFCYTIVEK
ncbi:hypothetical protein GCM10008942_06740 [Rhizomicrobium electricum]|uniref:Methyltransferase type 11 domain-containing protein n=2 Tax=Rhizomicrobium electricum TaxID=480070 RepID=A0ABN1E7Y7_9PROT|nr:SAM-dependent methyltransferase [Rhizomicrobium electricum]